MLPFTALTGQPELKTALLLQAVSPAVGGVLIRGCRGTAKTEAVRGLAALLAAAAEPGEEPPFVELPLNATVDGVLGTIDLEAALENGERALSPGLLSRAHGGLLCIDEINLLDPALTDCILDAAERGELRLEREGLSLSCPCAFSLLGTMDPGEGDLSPQLLDRFGLCVTVESLGDPAERLELLHTHLTLDRDPEAFARQHEPELQALATRIRAARELLPAVRIPEILVARIVRLSRDAHTAGHRADLFLHAASLAHAAWEGRDTVTDHDITAVAPLVLGHRARRKTPPAEPPRENRRPEPQTPPADHRQNPSDNDRSDEAPAGAGSAAEHIFAVGAPTAVQPLASPGDRLLRDSGGRRSMSLGERRSGRTVGSRSAPASGDVALAATLRAAALHRKSRPEGNTAVVIKPADLRYKVRRGRTANLIVLVVDASGSMGARERMVTTKGAVFSLLLDAYRRRDRVALVTFRRDRAEVVLPPTRSMDRARRLLAELPTGGRTPLARGLETGYRMILAELRRDPTVMPLLVVVSDGRANAAAPGRRPLEEVQELARGIAGDRRVHSVVIDSEEAGFARFGLAERLAVDLGAEHWPLERFAAGDLRRLLGTDRSCSS